jgi:riboflavin biosynthesis pyrimidine reductase
LHDCLQSGLSQPHFARETVAIHPHGISLYALGFRRILVEGGARTIAAFIEEGCLDRLHVLVAPVIIGSGRSGLDLPPEPKLALALRPNATAHLLGHGEVLFDCDFAAYRRSAS